MPIELKELDELFTSAQASAVREFIIELGLTFGSVDLYTRNGKIGLFEFCPQFGFYRMDPSDIQQLHKDFIIDAVGRYDDASNLFVLNDDLPARITSA